MEEILRIGVVGFGYWGPNIVRNFNSIPSSKVVSICDKRLNARLQAEKMYPGVMIVNDYADIVDSCEIDAVAVVSPVSTHYELAKRALKNGKHIFVEKPFTEKSSEAMDLIELAEKKNLKIMVDHTFLFTGAVRKMKHLVDNATLGNLYYYDSIRVNLGLFQHDVNVIWDLAPHDLSVMDYVISKSPVAITANGISHFNTGFEDMAYITLYFDEPFIAHFNVNWLSPVKVRTTLIGGKDKMLVWNDLESDEKIKVYDRGVNVETKEGEYRLLVNYRSGDMWSPKIEPTEALRLEAEYFVDCILNDMTPINDGHAGLRVVRILEASDMSISKGGRPIEL